MKFVFHCVLQGQCKLLYVYICSIEAMEIKGNDSCISPEPGLSRLEMPEQALDTARFGIGVVKQEYMKIYIPTEFSCIQVQSCDRNFNKIA